MFCIESPEQEKLNCNAYGSCTGTDYGKYVQMVPATNPHPCSRESNTQPALPSPEGINSLPILNHNHCDLKTRHPNAQEDFLYYLKVQGTPTGVLSSEMAKFREMQTQKNPGLYVTNCALGEKILSTPECDLKYETLTKVAALMHRFSC